MTDLLTEAFDKAQNLPSHLQDELARQLIEDIENELNIYLKCLYYYMPMILF